MEITFTNSIGTEHIFPPEPASKNIPEWYKNMESYPDGIKKPSGAGTTTATIKKCMPVFDAMTSGYIIKSQADVYVSQKDVYGIDEKTGDEVFITKQPYYEWAEFNLIKFHPSLQAPDHPNRNNHLEYPKWQNPWAIKTPKGYSCIITNPLHRDSIFTILTGVVDTDKYSTMVNFPFVLNDINFEGLIPAGTPIAQIIPFKRDDWKMRIGNEKDIIDMKKTDLRVQSRFFDAYKDNFRSSKVYK